MILIISLLQRFPVRSGILVLEGENHEKICGLLACKCGIPAQKFISPAALPSALKLCIVYFL
jgi:hypothetical protein